MPPGILVREPSGKGWLSWMPYFELLDVRYMCGDLGKATRSRQMSFHVKCSIVKLFLDVFDYLWKFLKIIKNQWIDLLKQFKKLCIKYSKESSKQQLTQFLFLATSHCFSQITTHMCMLRKSLKCRSKFLKDCKFH